MQSFALRHSVCLPLLRLSNTVDVRCKLWLHGSATVQKAVWIVQPGNWSFGNKTTTISDTYFIVVDFLGQVREWSSSRRRLSVLQEGRYLPRNFISHHHCNRARWIKTTTFQFQVRIICCMFLILLCLPAPCSAVLPASLLPFFPSSLTAAWQLRTEPKSEFLETVSRWCLK